MKIFDEILSKKLKSKSPCVYILKQLRVLNTVIHKLCGCESASLLGSSKCLKMLYTFSFIFSNTANY
jgi:hypothetical protein